MKKTFSYRKIGRQLVAVAVAMVGFGASQVGFADTWQATPPEQIKVVEGQNFYILQKGDTLWAVSQAVGIDMEVLAKLSDIDLASGQQYRLSVGYVIRWNDDKTEVQLVTPSGEVEASATFTPGGEVVVNQSPTVENTSIQSTEGVEKVQTNQAYQGIESIKETLQELSEVIESISVTEDGISHVKLKDYADVKEVVEKLEELKQSEEIQEVQDMTEEVVEDEPETEVSELPTSETTDETTSEAEIESIVEEVSLIDRLKTSQKEGALSFQILKSELLDGEVLYESGYVSNVEFDILSFFKDGKYVIKRMNTKDKTGTISKVKRSSEELVRQANSVEALAMFTSGMWSYATSDLETYWRDTIGQNGLLYSDSKNNLVASFYDNNDISEMYEFIGKDGWNIGTITTIVSNGEFIDDWATSHGVGSERTARVFLLEKNDGVVKVVNTYGHSSSDTGLSRDEVIDFFENIGFDEIKTLSMLEGGGSTRMYVKHDDGTETVNGVFVDDRYTTDYLYLGERDNGILNEEKPYAANEQMLAEGVSTSVTADMYFTAKDNGESRIEGTVYELSVEEVSTDEVE